MILAAVDLPRCRLGVAAGAVRGEGSKRHYWAIAEPGSEGGLFLTFPGGAGYSFAEDDRQILAQAQDWLASAAMDDGELPPAIEDGAPRPTDLSGFPPGAFVMVIPFDPVAEKAAAGGHAPVAA